MKFKCCFALILCLMLLNNKYVNKSFNSCYAKYECLMSTLIIL